MSRDTATPARPRLAGPEDSLALIRSLGFGDGVRFTRSITSSVTTGWGVQWEEDWIARDLMQNFFDANKDNLAEVCVTAKGDCVSVMAPAGFDLCLLYYLGSEKGPDDVGQYGEGYKAAVICLLRDYGVVPVAASGCEMACIRIANNPIPGTELRPLIYDLFETDEPCDGHQLVLVGCSERLSAAMQQGLTHFFHGFNPLIGERLWSSADGQFEIFASRDTQGHIFYRNLKRGDFPGIPLVLAIHKAYRAIDNRVARDRDRNAFGDELLGLFYRTFARSGLRWDIRGIQCVLKASRDLWPSGHALLAAIATAARYDGPALDLRTSQRIFRDRYFARSKADFATEQLRFDQLESAWEAAGRQRVPGYFTAFCVISAKLYLEALDAESRKELLRVRARPPTAAEAACLAPMKAMLGALAPELKVFYERGLTRYTIIPTDFVAGEFRARSSGLHREVLLSERLFEKDFAEALATFLHEHAHVFGHDGSRGFTDSLTNLIEAIVRCRAQMDDFDARWREACANVQIEREQRPASPASKAG